MFSMIPYRTIRTMKPHTESRELYNPFMDDFFRAFWGNDTGFGMNVDVREEDGRYLLEADLPGVRKEDVQITVDDGTLTISAQLNGNTEEKQQGYLYRERRCGNFSRSFRLEGIDESAIEANYQDGVLRMVLPKLPEAVKTARQIEVK